MIGVFDSGIGGLTVVRSLMKQLPNYDIIYFGDTARTPYGSKSPETVVGYALENTEFLLKQGAKIIVMKTLMFLYSKLYLRHQQKQLKVPGI